MPRGGRRYHLVLYTYLLDRWWRAVLGVGVIMLALVAGLVRLPEILPQYHFLPVSTTTLWVMGGAGIYAVLLAVFLIAIRKMAYVRPYSAYLRLATPFLRMNISYRRILRASSVEMLALFPLERFKGWRRKLLRPLATRTATVLEMNGWPLPRWALRLFLSPFFFPGKTPRLSLLVANWIEFSTELESFRGTWFNSLHKPASTPQSNLLASLSRRKR
jgi:hypothetical protein